MRRLLVGFVIIGLLGVPGVAGADHGNRVERTVVGTYEPPFFTPVTGCKSLMGPWACLIVQTSTSEAFFTAKITDAHGLPIYAHVIAQGRVVGSFCGQIDQSISFPPGSLLEFRIGLERPSPPECSAPKTMGTIAVTLSNLP